MSCDNNEEDVMYVILYRHQIYGLIKNEEVLSIEYISLFNWVEYHKLNSAYTNGSKMSDLLYNTMTNFDDDALVYVSVKAVVYQFA